MCGWDQNQISAVADRKYDRNLKVYGNSTSKKEDF